MAHQIKEPHLHDYLKGRGNRGKFHHGNKYFHELVLKHKLECARCLKKSEKRKFAELIYDEIKALDPPGRFLKPDKDTKLWSDIGEKKAVNTILQALREGAPELTKNGTTEGNNNLFNEVREESLRSLEYYITFREYEKIFTSSYILAFPTPIYITSSAATTNPSASHSTSTKP